MQKTAFTVNELSNELGIGRSKIYLEIQAGRLKPRKLGSRTIFLAADIANYLNSLPEAGGRNDNQS